MPQVEERELPSLKYYRDRVAHCTGLADDASSLPQVRESYLRMARSYLLLSKDLERRGKQPSSTSKSA
jgi:hypothetical protein